MEKNLRWTISQEEIQRGDDGLNRNWEFSREDFSGTEDEVKKHLLAIVDDYVHSRNVFIEECTTSSEELNVDESKGIIKAFVCFTYWQWEDPVVITAVKA